MYHRFSRVAHARQRRFSPRGAKKHLGLARHDPPCESRRTLLVRSPENPDGHQRFLQIHRSKTTGSFPERSRPVKNSSAGGYTGAHQNRKPSTKPCIRLEVGSAIMVLL